MDWFKVSAAALAVMGGMSACAPAIVDPPTTGQAYLFEVSYVNFAWGLRWVGIVIEADGAIVAYEREEPPPIPYREEDRSAAVASNDDVIAGPGEVDTWLPSHDLKDGIRPC